MAIDPAIVALVLITLAAATVNGALGYGFSSLTVPVALLFYSNRILSPALVLVEVVLNWYTLFANWKSLPKVWRRVLPVLIGLVPGTVAGSYFLSVAQPGLLKLIVYAILLPLILCQAAGIRRPIQNVRVERAVGGGLGLGVGILYGTTTISGPPIAIMLNNQGLVKEEFRASLGIIRVVESTLTAISFYFMGLFSPESLRLLPWVLPSVLIALPLGMFIIQRVASETFRRICMSFDAWVVGFGLSRVMIDLHILASPYAYIAFVLAMGIDVYLLTRFFRVRRFVPVNGNRQPELE